MVKVFSLLLSVIAPGTGHLIRRQYLRASGLMLAFVAALDGVIIARWLIKDEGFGASLMTWSLIALAAVWLVAVGHTFYLCFIFNEKRHRRRVEILFTEGQQDYLRGDHEAALAAFRQSVRLEPEDPDVRFYLALAYRALGHTRRARRTLRKCLDIDTKRKWTWEVENILKAMK